jgi:hypothetical protein
MKKTNLFLIIAIFSALCLVFGCSNPSGSPIDLGDNLGLGVDNGETVADDTLNDIDGDGIPNDEDDDVDGDGIPNINDPQSPDYSGDADGDGDGIPNINDPESPNYQLPGGGGADDDNDGIPNINDPDSPNYQLPGGGGADDDGDTIPNINDPDSPNYTLPGGGGYDDDGGDDTEMNGDIIIPGGITIPGLPENPVPLGNILNISPFPERGNSYFRVFVFSVQTDNLNAILGEYVIGMSEDGITDSVGNGRVDLFALGTDDDAAPACVFVVFYDDGEVTEVWGTSSAHTMGGFANAWKNNEELFVYSGNCVKLYPSP